MTRGEWGRFFTYYPRTEPVIAARELLLAQELAIGKLVSYKLQLFHQLVES